MLKISQRTLVASALNELRAMQAEVDACVGYPDKVSQASKLWDSKTSTVRRKAAFQDVRSTLALMCVGPVRCAYCEDSLADEVEHIYPKNIFPQKAFAWINYAFACGPCNGPKSNRYAVIRNGEIHEFKRGPRDPVTPPPRGRSGLIDPRVEDPTKFLELDIGGVTPDGIELDPTFEFLPRYGLDETDNARAEFTIDVLGLNREVLRDARRNAFGGFRARLTEYVTRKNEGADQDELRRLKDDLLGTPHLTVFFEMRRQRAQLPQLAALLAAAPEAMGWSLVP